MFENGLFFSILNHDGDYYQILVKYAIEQGDMSHPEEFLETLEGTLLDGERKKQMMTMAKRLEKRKKKSGI